MKFNREKSIILTTSFPLPHQGGLSRGICYEALYFANRGYDVSIIYSAGKGSLNSLVKHKKISLISKISASNKGPFGQRWLLPTFSSAFSIRKLAQASKAQCIHAHDAYAALSCIISGNIKKTALHLHSVASKDRFIMSKPLSNLDCRSKFFTLIDYVRDFIIELIVYNLVRLIVCVSEYEQQDAVKKSLNKNKIFVLRNGVDNTLFKPNPKLRKKLRDEMSIDEDTVVCMFLGRMVPKNGAFLIAKAIPLVTLESPKILFVFVGDGEERKKVTDYVRNEKLTGTLFLGELRAENILPLADIFLSHVSSLVDGHGQTILEAMASGIPTITGRDPIKEKNFKDGEEIILVSKDNPQEIARQIVSLVRDERKRKQVSVNARKKVEKSFSLEVTMKKLECILNQVS